MGTSGGNSGRFLFLVWMGRVSSQTDFPEPMEASHPVEFRYLGSMNLRTGREVFRGVSQVVMASVFCQMAMAGDNMVLKTYPVKASQGVAVDGKHFYAISNTKIAKHDKATGKLVAEWQAKRGDKTTAHFRHMNSGTVFAGKLYCAHSRFPLDPNDNSVEVFGVEGEAPTHESTIRMPRDHGSLTWIDRRGDGTWWFCYAVYGKPGNAKTKLLRCRMGEGKFIEEREWFFPEETVARWGAMSCSGGSWGPDGFLYVTGHDHAEACVLKIDGEGDLIHVSTERVPGISGQAIAWDRFSDKPLLWGIVKGKHVSAVLITAEK